MVYVVAFSYQKHKIRVFCRCRGCPMGRRCTMRARKFFISCRFSGLKHYRSWKKFYIVQGFLRSALWEKKILFCSSFSKIFQKDNCFHKRLSKIRLLIRLNHWSRWSECISVMDLFMEDIRQKPLKLKKLNLCKIWLCLWNFFNEEIRPFDGTCLKGEVFEPLKDESIFRNCVIEYGVPTWCDGEIDCAPEFIYDNSYEYDANHVA